MDVSVKTGISQDRLGYDTVRDKYYIPVAGDKVKFHEAWAALLYPLVILPGIRAF